MLGDAFAKILARRGRFIYTILGSGGVSFQIERSRDHHHTSHISFPLERFELLVHSFYPAMLHLQCFARKSCNSASWRVSVSLRLASIAYSPN
jgi:hypothetical protein